MHFFVLRALLLLSSILCSLRVLRSRVAPRDNGKTKPRCVLLYIPQVIVSRSRKVCSYRVVVPTGDILTESPFCDRSERVAPQIVADPLRFARFGQISQVGAKGPLESRRFRWTCEQILLDSPSAYHLLSTAGPPLPPTFIPPHPNPHLPPPAPLLSKRCPASIHATTAARPSKGRLAYWEGISIISSQASWRIKRVNRVSTTSIATTSL